MTVLLRTFLGALLLCHGGAALAAPSEGPAVAGATTVVLVRHAEKAREPRRDPPLTAVGHRRAQAIARLLEKARVDRPVDAVFASPYQRTRDTAAPLAARAAVPVSDYDPRDSEALATRVLSEYAGGTVVVVGHSNTLPDLVTAFGAAHPVPPIEDDEYENLYVLTVPAGDGEHPAGTSVLRLTLAKEGERPVPSRSALAAIEAWHTVREHFLDAERVSGDEWVRAYAEYLQALPPHADSTQASAAINAMLATLRTSHTSHYTPLDTAWYQLLGIFADQFAPLRERRFREQGGEVSYEGLPIAVQRLDGKVFVSGLYHPLQEVGEQSVLIGDELLTVDGQPFDEIEPFRGKVGQAVQLGIRREAGGPALMVPVVVERLRPGTLFLDAMERSAEVREPAAGVRIAHVRMWSYAGSRYHDALRALLRQPPYAGADALVLDLRGGWGGADPSYADYFLSRTATLTMRSRDGVASTYNDHWLKPLVVLVDEASRSGKEVLAATLQAQGVPLVGSRTGGAVTAGRPFALVDDSLLYLAVAAVTVDGEVLEGKGVTPDVAVDRRLPYAAGEDPQLQRALALAQALITRSAPGDTGP